MRLNLILFIILFLSINQTFSQSLPWSDNFDDGDLLGWTVVDDQPNTSGPGNWQVLDGILTQSSNIWVTENEYEVFLGTHIHAGNPDWQDYSFNAHIRSLDNDGIGILFRYQDQDNYYRVILLQDPGNRGPFQRLQKRINGTFITLQEDTPDIAIPQGLFSITADVRGDSINIYINQELIFTNVDASLPAGKIGFMCYGHSGANIDSVSVSAEKVIYSKPEQHLVVTERLPYVQMPKTNSVQIAWRTTDKIRGQLDYGETPDYGNSIYEDSLSHKHLVTISGLEQNTKYYYRVLNAGQVMAGPDSFYTAKAPSVKTASFLIWGDSGTGDSKQSKVAALLEKEKADFCLHVGDVSQSDGREYDNIFFKPYQNIVKSRCIFTSIGNHDTYADNAQTYMDDFYLPHNNPDSTERYYSFNWGNAHCIALDSNIDYAPGSPQYKWLIEDLSSEMRDETDWTFIYFHHPPYCQGWDVWAGDVNVQNYLVPVFENHKVDMVFNGHTHDYERGLLNGVYYVITGGGGGYMDTWGREYEHIDVTIFKFHYTRVDINGNRLHLQAYDTDEKQIESLVITKTANGLDVFKNDLPVTYHLSPNYPNPFNPSTMINYQLPKATEVEITIHNLLGQKVSTLVSQRQQAGLHQVQWDASGFSSGIYYYKITAGDFLDVKKMMLVK